MKAFKIFSGDHHYAISAMSQEEAVQLFTTDIGAIKDIDRVEEIPESEWDARTIAMWVDNDFETEPFYTSIREQIGTSYPELIYSTDHSLID